jgi:hypothetical protein
MRSPCGTGRVTLTFAKRGIPCVFSKDRKRCFGNPTSGTARLAERGPPCAEVRDRMITKLGESSAGPACP